MRVRPPSWQRLGKEEEGGGGELLALPGNLLTYPPLYIVAGAALCLFEPVRTNLLVGGLLLCLLITLYGFLTKNEKHVNPVEVGDNCYFIGFVFTLVVISLAIYFDTGVGRDAGPASAPGEAQPGQRADFNKLLHAVSVALVTSIWGMVMRFALAQGEKEPEKLLDQRIRQVSKEVARLAVSLDSSVTATRDYNVQLREETRRLGDSLNEEFARLIGELAEKTHEALAHVHFDRVHTELTRAVDAHIGAVNTAAQSLAHTRESFERIAKEIDASAKTLADSAERFKDTVGDPDWKRMGDALKDFSDKVSSVGGSIELMLNHYKRLSTETHADLQRMGDVRKRLQALVAEIEKDVATVGKIKERYRATFQEAAEDAMRETHKLYSRLIAGAEIAIANTKDLGRLGDDIRHLADKLDSLKGDAAKE